MATEVTVPMVGKIVGVNVNVGDKVSEDDQIATLEAMKMKNTIRSDRDGVIAQVNVNVGDLVKHNQPLFTFQA